MKISRRRAAVTIRFDETFSMREAIGLPSIVRRLAPVASVTLDFRGVRSMRESALATLIPALASLHRPPVRVLGLGGAKGQLADLVAAGV